MDYNARYYSPYLGRFVSPDTVVPDPTTAESWNRYSYVQNNPLNFTDTTGHCREEDENYSDCVALADQAASLIDSDKTWDGTSLYDLNWTSEEQVQEFVQFHNELPGIIEQHQFDMATIQDQFGPKPEDVQAMWDDVDQFTDALSDKVHSYSYETLKDLFARNPEWQETIANIGADTTQVVVGEVVLDLVGLVPKGVLGSGWAVAEAINISMQATVVVSLDHNRRLYQNLQPKHPQDYSFFPSQTTHGSWGGDGLLR